MQWKNVDGVVNKQADSAAPYFVSIDRTQVIRHQNDAISVVLVSLLLTLNIFHDLF